MMTYGGGWFGGLAPLTMLAALVGVVLLVAGALNSGAGRGDDEALSQLRLRFARGEIDAEQYERMRQALGAEHVRRPGPNLAVIGLILIVAAIVLGVSLSTMMPGGWGYPAGRGGMMGPGRHMMWDRAAPTGPSGYLPLTDSQWTAARA